MPNIMPRFQNVFWITVSSIFTSYLICSKFDFCTKLASSRKNFWNTFLLNYSWYTILYNIVFWQLYALLNPYPKYCSCYLSFSISVNVCSQLLTVVKYSLSLSFLPLHLISNKLVSIPEISYITYFLPISLAEPWFSSRYILIAFCWLWLCLLWIHSHIFSIIIFLKYSCDDVSFLVQKNLVFIK